MMENIIRMEQTIIMMELDTLADNSFDVIVSFQVLEHIKDLHISL